MNSTTQAMLASQSSREELIQIPLTQAQGTTAMESGPCPKTPESCNDINNYLQIHIQLMQFAVPWEI